MALVVKKIFIPKIVVCKVVLVQSASVMERFMVQESFGVSGF